MNKDITVLTLPVDRHFQQLLLSFSTISKIETTREYKLPSARLPPK
jgi:hypothetical protein